MRTKLFIGFLCLLFVFSEALGSPVSDLQCKVVSLYRECSGCSLRGAKAILEVIQNRMQIEHKTACQIIRSSAFPWSNTQYSWKFSQEQLTRYFDVLQLSPVVGKGVYHFNNERFTTFGRYCCKVDGNYFYYRS